MVDRKIVAKLTQIPACWLKRGFERLNNKRQLHFQAIGFSLRLKRTHLVSNSNLLPEAVFEEINLQEISSETEKVSVLEFLALYTQLPIKKEHYQDGQLPPAEFARSHF